MQRDVLVFGGSGYSGMELLRLLAGHPHANLVGASSGRWADAPLSQYIPQWAGPHRFVPHDGLLDKAAEGQIAFLATAATVSLDLAPKLLERGVSVVDLSGAFRLASNADYEQWYGFTHDALGHLESAVYGLPELVGVSVEDALGSDKPQLIANPGCYATAAIVAVAPLLAADLLEADAPIVLDGKSGATGAGRKLADSLLFSEVAETTRPYRLAAHQHTPEMERYLSKVAGRDVKVSFTAHLLSIRRGLLVSAYCRAKDGVDQAALDKAYADAYDNQAFVRVLSEREPHPGPIISTNMCDVRAKLDARTRTVLAFGAIDNLVKGAAGQAVQNFNLLLGKDMTTGLLGTQAPGGAA